MGYKHFVITEDQRKEYAAGFLLDYMISQETPLSVVLEGANQDLEPVLIYMMSKDFLTIDEKNFYIPTQIGREKYENLKSRYEEYLAHFDLYCAVDLEEGEFAFAQIFELEDEEWEAHLREERFVDLRIAVAWFKKINPADFVFLSYLKEGLFDTANEGWQFDIMSGLSWNKIEEIVDTAIQVEELAYIDDSGQEIAGESVIQDVIEQGAKLNVKLHAEEEHLNQQDHEHDNDFHDGNNGGFVTTYESYYDPFYVSPIWFLF